MKNGEDKQNLLYIPKFCIQNHSAGRQNEQYFFCAVNVLISTPVLFQVITVKMMMMSLCRRSQRKRYF